MPHVIFLHLALTQRRIIIKDTDKLKRLFHFEVIDVVIAMLISRSCECGNADYVGINIYAHGLREIGTLEEAYKTLTPFLGSGRFIYFCDCADCSRSFFFSGGHHVRSDCYAGICDF